MGPRLSLSRRGLSQNGPEDQQVVCSVNVFLCMSHAHKGVWAGGPEAAQPLPLTGAVDPQPTTEAVDPQPHTGALEPQTAVSSAGGFSDAELGALTPEEIQVAKESDRLTDRQLTRALTALGAKTTVKRPWGGGVQAAPRGLAAARTLLIAACL